jgi:hypothetical protein
MNTSVGIVFGVLCKSVSSSPSLHTSTSTYSLDGEDRFSLIFLILIEGRTHFEWNIGIVPYILSTVFFIISIETTPSIIQKFFLLFATQLINNLIFRVVFVFV